MTTERLMMRLKLAPMGLDPRVHLLRDKVFLRRWIAGSGPAMTEGAAMNPIDLEIIYQSTLQIARELTVNMLRTGYSTIIKESQDFTFAIFDAQGRMVAQGIPQPLHIGPLAAQVNKIRRRFTDAAPGDAFIVNHPYHACQDNSTDG